MGRAKAGTDTFCQLCGRKQTGRLNDISLGVSPVRLNRIKPGTLDGKQAGNNAHSLLLLFDSTIVVADPVPHLVTNMPGAIIPDHDQSFLMHQGELLATPSELLDCDIADWSAIYKAQPYLLW